MILILIVISVLALLLAPLLMPQSYNWIVHTTSESGAQGVEGAWLTRAGFIVYGIAVFVLSLVNKSWSVLARITHGVFGICMIGNAVFSSRPWQVGMPYSELEDLLHSWMSGLVGTAFTIGVILVFFLRKPSDILAKLFDVMAVLVSIGVTVLMFGSAENIAGLVQRIIFAVSYLWYAKETLAGNR